MNKELLERVVVDPRICGGKPVVRGTRIYVSIILDSLSENLTPEQIIDHFPNLKLDDIRAALAYGALLAQENTFKVAV
ncbi:MAG TPA: DUF433 domain-containing protein [Planctomycetota bacterium]|jgi:uncharacterized protein (DUF433 family)